MKRMMIGGVLLALLALASVPGNAQRDDAVAGLVVNTNGDLYEWDGSTFTPLTNYGANRPPVQSPDGRYIAYLSVAEAALDSTRYAGGTRPMNVWVLDRQTGDFQRIADAANGLRFRGEPAWSPDSTRLAWTELADGTAFDGTLDLVAYDLRTSTRTTITNNFTQGPSDGGLYMPPVQWGAGGISHLYATVIMGPNPGQMIFELYNPDSGAMTSYTVGQTQDSYIVDYLWVTHQETAGVAFVTRNGVWWLLDPATGARQNLAAPPTRRVTMTIADIALTPRFQTGQMGFDFAWDAVFYFDGGAPPVTVTLPYRSPLVSGRFAPALKGAAVAWNNEGNVVVQTATGAQTVATNADFTPGMMDPYGGAVWYPTSWRIEQNTTPPPVVIPTPLQSANCEIAPQFGPGNQIRITDGAPNNLRRQPTTSSEVLGRLPAGTSMTVLDPALCSEGYYWYRVQGTEWQGWTAAGPNHDWIERVPGTPIDPCPLPPRLRPGDLAAVTDGVPNNLRTEPGRGGTVTGRLPAGTVMEIVNGPACVDGLYWYEVLGSEWRGWTAEGQDGTYWLAPFTPNN